MANPANTATITAIVPGICDGRKILIGHSEWGNGDVCWYDDVCIFTDPVLITETGIPAATAVFENPASGATEDTYTIELLQAPASTVTITATPYGGDNFKSLSVGGMDPNTSYDVVFNAGEMGPKTVQVSTLPDLLEQQGPYIIAIGHSAVSADAAFNNALIAPVNVTVYDDDAAYVLVNPGDGVEVTEVDPLQTDSYTVQLLSVPGAEVLVTVGADTAQVTTDPVGDLTFQPQDWASPQTVIVSAVDDELSGDDAEGDPHTTILTHIVTSDDTDYSELGTADSVRVSIIDNDCGSWPFEPMDFNENCNVDLQDLATFAAKWLACTTPYEPGCIRLD